MTRRHVAPLLLFALGALALLHFRQLNRLHLAPNCSDVDNVEQPTRGDRASSHGHGKDYDGELIRRRDRVASKNVARDPSASYDHVFGNRTRPARDDDASSRPPDEDSWLLSPSDSKHDDGGRIPRTINKMYFQKDGLFAEHPPPPTASPLEFVSFHSLREAHRSWSVMNPGYAIRYYNLHTAREYLRAFLHPAFLRTFDCIQAFAGKSDFFRMVLLYRDGGFHADWKMECLEHGLLDRIANVTSFFIAVDLGGAFVQREQKLRMACAQNSFVGSTPRHPILTQYLRLVMEHVHNGYYPVNRNPLYLTGPGAFGRAVRRVDETFGNDAASWPVHKDNHYFWEGRRIVRTKCEFCGSGQRWAHGNNYNWLIRNRTFYCEDSASIFREGFK